MFPSRYDPRYITCYCPSCFQQICLGMCAIISAIDGTIIKEVPTKPKEIEKACLNPAALTGEYYTQLQAQRRCHECDYLLPYNIENVDSVIIAVVGDSFSGKSHYITALLYQIYQWMHLLSNYGAQIECLTKDIEIEYQRNLERLFVNKQAVNLTIPATGHILPLIYQLTIASSSLLGKKAKDYNIIIYDASGEDFANNGRLSQYGKFALYADAIIFTIDPVPIRELFDKLDFTNQLYRPQLDRQQLEKNHNAGRRPIEIVRSVIHTFRRNLNLKPEQPLSIPIAVMISKADLLEYLWPPPHLTSLNKYPQYGIKVDFEDLEQVNQDVETLLRDYGQNDLLGVLNLQRDQSRDNVRFFASTATNSPPNANDEFTNPRPYRCLDPLLWIFYQLKIMGKK